MELDNFSTKRKFISNYSPDSQNEKFTIKIAIILKFF